MGTCYEYYCDICGVKRNNPYPSSRRYTIKVKGVKVTVNVNTTNDDDLCNSCFDALVKGISKSENFKEGRSS